MCGIVGLVTSEPSLPIPHNLKMALLEIQHRGYDGAGLILDNLRDPFLIEKKTGLIQEALPESLISGLNYSDGWSAGLAHTRYKTSGELNLESVQPLVSKNGKYALVHNGHIKNQPEPSKLSATEPSKLSATEPSKLSATEPSFPGHGTNSDSLQILQIWEASEIQFESTIESKIPQALNHIFHTLEGSYSCLLLIKDYGLLAFRDPQGIRPLVWAYHPIWGSMFASETVAFKHLPSPQTWKIQNIGSATGVLIRLNRKPKIYGPGIENSPGFGDARSSIGSWTPCLLPCLFEYIYLADPDSIIDGLSVRQARKLMGQSLARRIKQEYPQLKLDMVVPIPDSSCLATKALAKVLSVPYHELLTLNEHGKQSRSFILPTQAQREKAVRHKFSFGDRNMTGIENILLVDDSIVRGTTIKYIIQALRSHYPELQKIYVASIAPVIRHANRFGIDIPENCHLIAHQRTIPEITKIIGADLIIYQELHEMERSLLMSLDSENQINGFEDSMFDSSKN